ncbi:MAG: aldo/keto reductase [Lutibacter sp.]
MKFNKFINGTPSVSEIGFGAWQIGKNSGWKSITEKDAIRLVHKSIELGVNFFDTAPNYGYGSSESILGKALNSFDRSKIVINTKFGHTVNGKTNFDSSYIKKSLEGSLKRLKVEYVDSLIIHNPPKKHLDGRYNKHYEILEKLKDEGKIKEYGASVDTAEEINILLNTTKSKVIEVFYNILHQDVAKSFPLVEKKEVGVIGKIPLDSGWLTNKYNENSVFNDIRSRWSKYDISTRAKLVNRINEIVGKNHSLSQLAISFCLAQPNISTVIPGSLNLQQLNNNINAASLNISKNMVTKLQLFYEEEVKPLNIPW